LWIENRSDVCSVQFTCLWNENKVRCRNGASYMLVDSEQPDLFSIHKDENCIIPTSDLFSIHKHVNCTILIYELFLIHKNVHCTIGTSDLLSIHCYNLHVCALRTA
jgi:hypothetical protein